MSYTAPDGDAADFTFAGASAYTAPAGGAADFSFVESTGCSVDGNITTADSPVTSSASVSPVAVLNVTTADCELTGVASASAGASGLLITADGTASSSATVSPVATASFTAADSTFAGSAASGSSVASMSITTEDAFTAAVASASPLALMAAYTDAAAVSGSAQGQVTGVYPDPATVLSGVVYGPSGADYTGTLIWSSAADISAAVLVALQDTTIPVDLTKVRGQSLVGVGTELNPWGPA